jgi:hypothetical protein
MTAPKVEHGLPGFRYAPAAMAFTVRMARNHPRLLALAASLVAVLSISVAAVASAGTRPVWARPASVAPLMGVNVLDVDPLPLGQADTAIEQAHALHATVVRTNVGWSDLEPSGPNAMDQGSLAFMDRLVSDAAARGIRVIMTVGSSPCWASSAPAAILSQCVPTRPSEAKRWPPRNPGDYAAFVAFLARRYGARLAAIEIWNEPDQSNQLYLAGPEKVQRYAAILKAAYPAIKQADPGVTVLGGSLVGSNGVFLRALYANGIKGYYDGLAVHYYNLTLASLRSIREVQLANRDVQPLWLDEFGWSDCYPHERIQEEQACVTTQVQAANLSSTLRTLARTSYVAAAVVFELQDSPRVNFGVLSVNGARKRVFQTLAGVFASPFAPVPKVSLSLRRRGNRVVASGSGPVGDFMGLEAFHGSALRFRAVFTLDRFNRYSIVLPRALGSRGMRVRVFQYWAGLGRATQRSI